MNLIEQSNVLKGLDDAMLQQQVQAGTVPPYLVLSEMNRRKDMRARYEGELARRKPQTTVAEDTMASLGPSMTEGGPMAAAPAIDPAAMGSGAGIAAAVPGGGGPGFADGGIVDYASVAKRYNDKLNGLDEEKDRARALALLAASAGMLSGGSSNTLKNVGLGINAGVKSYGEGLTAIDSRESELLRNLTDLDLTQQDRVFREREFAYRQQNDAADRAAAEAERLAKNTDRYSATTIWGVDENGERVSARTNLNTGEYKINPRADGSIPASFVPFSADELVEQREDAKVLSEKKEQMPRAAAGVTTALRTASTAMGTIKDAFNQANFWNTGPVGDVASALLGGGWSKNLRALVLSLKSRLGADAIAAMREASKNGAALGNTSNADLELLQTTIANLDPNQGEEQLKRQLERVYDELNAALEVRVDTFNQIYGGLEGAEAPELELPPPTFEEFMSVDVENDPMDPLVDKYRTR
jgi:hypothetical protein